MRASIVGDTIRPVTSAIAEPAVASPTRSQSVAKSSQFAIWPSRSAADDRPGSYSDSTSASAKMSVAPRLNGWRGLPSILIGRVWYRVIGQLTAVAGSDQIALEQPRCQLVGEDRYHGRQPDPDLALIGVECGLDNRARRHLWLEDRRHRLRPLAELVERPVELRRIDRRQMHHDEPDRTAVMDQLGADGIGKAAHRVFRAAIGRLQRDRPVGERRANIDDGAMVTLTHARQCCHRPVDLAEIGDFSGATKLLRSDPIDWRKYRRHRIVDPNIDRSQLGFDAGGGGLERVGIGDIRNDR